MRKIKCDKCAKINFYEKNDEFIYCGKCKNKLLVNDVSNKKYIYVIVSVLLFFVVGLIVFFSIFDIWQINKKIYISDVEKVCDNKNNCLLNDVFLDNIFAIKNVNIKNDILYDVNKEKYEVEVVSKKTTKTFNFKIKDNVGADIKINECIFNINEQIDLNRCVFIKDFVDGEISLNNDNVKYNLNNVDNTKEGIYNVSITVIDSSNIQVTKVFDVIVKKIKSTNIEISSNKDGAYTNEKIVFTANIMPENTYDKSVKWSYKLIEGEMSNKNFMKENIFNSDVPGVYEICVETNDTKLTTCKKINVYTKCLNTYTFKLSGGSSGVFSVGKQDDICPGIYRLYATTLNSNSTSYITIVHNGDYNWEFHLPSYDRGNKYVLEAGNYLEVEAGITQIKLIKQ